MFNYFLKILIISFCFMVIHVPVNGGLLHFLNINKNWLIPSLAFVAAEINLCKWESQEGLKLWIIEHEPSSIIREKRLLGLEENQHYYLRNYTILLSVTVVSGIYFLYKEENKRLDNKWVSEFLNQ